MQVKVKCSNKTSLQPVSKPFEQHFLYFKTAEEKVICLQTGEKTRQVYKGMFYICEKIIKNRFSKSLGWGREL